MPVTSVREESSRADELEDLPFHWSDRQILHLPISMDALRLVRAARLHLVRTHARQLVADHRVLRCPRARSEALPRRSDRPVVDLRLRDAVVLQRADDHLLGERLRRARGRDDA